MRYHSPGLGGEQHHALPSSAVENPRLLLVWRRFAHFCSRALACLGFTGDGSFASTYLFSSMSPTLDTNTWMSLAHGGDGGDMQNYGAQVEGWPLFGWGTDESESLQGSSLLARALRGFDWSH